MDYLAFQQSWVCGFPIGRDYAKWATFSDRHVQIHTRAMVFFLDVVFSAIFSVEPSYRMGT